MLEPNRVPKSSDTGFHRSLPWEIVVHDYAWQGTCVKC
jgi:hypothetical protein